jgi:hypothetical protein
MYIGTSKGVEGGVNVVNESFPMTNNISAGGNKRRDKTGHTPDGM